MIIEKTIYTHWESREWSSEGGAYTCWDMDMSSSKGFSKLLAKTTIQIEVPEIDGRQAMVETLQKERDEVIAVATAKAEKLSQRIEELLALPAAPAQETDQ